MLFEQEWTEKQRKLLFCGLLLLVFLWHLPVMTVFLPGEDSLDHTWMKILAYASENSFSFGKEFIFTYGPLGYLFRPVNKIDYLFSALLNLLFLLTLMDLFRFRTKREFCFRLLFAVLTLPLALHDLFLLFFPFTMLCLAGKVPERKIVLFSLFCTAVGALSVFMKFTFFPVALFSLLLADTRMFLRHKRCFLTGTFLLFLPVFWLLAGQKAGETGNFFLYSFAVMDGFNRSMSSFSAPIQWFFLALTVALFLFGIVLWRLYRKGKALSLWEKLLFAAGAALPLFTAYKYAVVRMDAGHLAGGLLSLRSFGAFLFCRDMPEKVIDGELLLRAGLFVLAAGIPVHIMTRPLPALRGEILDKVLLRPVCSLFRELPPPPFTGENGGKNAFRGKSCDLFAYGEFDTLRGMGFAYVPRPVMQSYSAYTESLMKLNQDHTASGKTDFLLFRLENLDKRFPMTSDFAILPLCGKYAPVRIFQGDVGEILLMKRDPAGKEQKLKKILEKSRSFGEEICLDARPDRMLYASMTFRYSLLGRLVSLLWRVPPLEIRFSTPEGEYVKDLVPDMAGTPFLLSPYLDKTEEFSVLWDARKREKTLAGKRMISFRILPTARLRSSSPCSLDEPAGRLLYRNDYTLVLYEAEFPGKKDPNGKGEVRHER
ncbi:MAG: hypothetical protein J6331_03070 [Lentisphaeria bacterium]|nr:hypothetical protein [Lentisphaeria bacterium]